MGCLWVGLPRNLSSKYAPTWRGMLIQSMFITPIAEPLSGISVVVGSIEFTNPLSCVRFLKSAVGSPTITCGGKYGGALSFRTGFVSYSIEYRILERKRTLGDIMLLQAMPKS